YPQELALCCSTRRTQAVVGRVALGELAIVLLQPMQNLQGSADPWRLTLHLSSLHLSKTHHTQNQR
ncbi:MAG: hypothetical protein AAF704_14970, partial [Cyanobacteria bacterium P01_D01_bin.123]